MNRITSIPWWDRKTLRRFALWVLLGCGAWGCDRAGEEASSPGIGPGFTSEERARILELSPLGEVPPSPTNRFADSDEAAALGQRLFFDPTLSASGEVSCATCHDPETGFTTSTPVAEGIGKTTRNAISLWNTAYQRWFFWDGRADSLWSQCLQPLEHPDEIGTTRVAVARRILSDPELRSAYESALEPLPDLAPEDLRRDARPVPGDESHPHHVAWIALPESVRESVNRVFAGVGKAIEAYERRLVSRSSAFDRFVAGLREGDADEGAQLSPAARRGLKIFVGRGQCTLCHTGPNFSDREFHNLGLDGGEGESLDLGRFGGVLKVREDPFNGLGEFSDDRRAGPNKKVRFVAQKPHNLGEFKTPSLRNVAETGPYMHDGRFATLTDVVRFYSNLDQEPALGHREESLVPLRLTPTEIADVVAFLESLTGAALPEELLRP